MEVLVLLILVIIILFPSAVPALDVISNPLKYDTFEELIDHILNFLVAIAFALAPLVILYAAFLYLTSEGEVYKIQKAKTLIYYAIIGLIIILLGKAVISVIESVLGTQSPTIPSP